MGKLWKPLVTFILALVFFFFLIVFIILCEASAGGVNLNFEIPDQRTEKFAKEFMSEIKKKEILIHQFTGYYFVKGILGAMRDKETGQTRSCIGIFIDDNEQPVFKIWCDELFSIQEIHKRAKEAAEYVFRRLKTMDDERKNSAKITT